MSMKNGIYSCFLYIDTAAILTMLSKQYTVESCEFEVMGTRYFISYYQYFEV